MNHFTKVLMIASALALLAACKLDVTTELYSTDLRDAMAGATDIAAPATMAFQVPSTDERRRLGGDRQA